ncbi:polyketide synthase PksL domain protein [Gracilaria domingensis]|nr:polyketide synthase PksL domain protein [Gracilaria domingensis]
MHIAPQLQAWLGRGGSGSAASKRAAYEGIGVAGAGAAEQAPRSRRRGDRQAGFYRRGGGGGGGLARARDASGAASIWYREMTRPGDESAMTFRRRSAAAAAGDAGGAAVVARAAWRRGLASCRHRRSSLATARALLATLEPRRSRASSNTRHHARVFRHRHGGRGRSRDSARAARAAGGRARRAHFGHLLQQRGRLRHGRRLAAVVPGVRAHRQRHGARAQVAVHQRLLRGGGLHHAAGAVAHVRHQPGRLARADRAAGRRAAARGAVCAGGHRQPRPLGALPALHAPPARRVPRRPVLPVRRGVRQLLSPVQLRLRELDIILELFILNRASHAYPLYSLVLGVHGAV